MRPFRYVLIGAVLALTPLASRAGAESALYVSPTCTGGATVSLNILFLDDPQNPSPLPPEWVGYDIYRRTFPGCTRPGVRVNDEIIPRPPAGVHELTYVDSPGVAGSNEYWVVFVDAERRPILLPSCYFCDLWPGYYGAPGYVACPPNQTPVTMGRIVDWGWALYVQNACPGSCWTGAYFSNDPWVDELRPYADTNTVIRFYGGIGCCSVEGAYLAINHYELSTCGVTPTVRTSWGQLKAIYR
jgi:hypothetical protein